MNEEYDFVHPFQWRQESINVKWELHNIPQLLFVDMGWKPVILHLLGTDMHLSSGFSHYYSF